MFDYIDGVMRAGAKKMTKWKEDLFFVVKLAGQKLSKYYAEVTPMTGMVHISTHILEAFRKLQSFRKWDQGMHINPDDETSYTTQYNEEFLQDVENESKKCKIIMPLGFATGPSLNHAGTHLIKSNQDENNYRWQQMMNG